MGTCASNLSAPSALPLLSIQHQPGHPSLSNSSLLLADPSTDSETRSQILQLEHSADDTTAFAVAVSDASFQDNDPKQIPNVETHWRCDNGLMWPQNVNYSRQCPKGHSLSVVCSLSCCHVCGGDASVCMSCAEGCTYGICALCMSSLNLASELDPANSSETCFLGVRSSFLKEFKTKWGHVTRGLTSGQVCKELVKPLTCLSRNSICEDLKRAGSVDVGQATLVLSHSWCNLFDDTLDAALEVVEEDSSGVLVSDC
jgi:hypothetical protein